MIWLWVSRQNSSSLFQANHMLGNYLSCHQGYEKASAPSQSTWKWLRNESGGCKTDMENNLNCFLISLIWSEVFYCICLDAVGIIIQTCGRLRNFNQNPLNTVLKLDVKSYMFKAVACLLIGYFLDFAKRKVLLSSRIYLWVPGVIKFNKMNK